VSFYATVHIGRDQFRALAGPCTTHEEALALAPLARERAERMDPRAVFYSYGTAQVDGPVQVVFPDLTKEKS
jgi:hypothetical protein